MEETKELIQQVSCRQENDVQKTENESENTDVSIQETDNQDTDVEKIDNETENIKVSIQKLENAQNEMKQIVNDTQIRMREIQDIIHDIKVRAHDTQDRTYDVISQLSLLAELKGYEKDIQTRIKDSQDRIYDLIWQLKTNSYQRDIMFWNLFKRTDESLFDAKVRFFKEMPPAQGDSRMIQLVLAKLLHTIHDICVSNNISYWLDFGSLIGAVRHSGYIPWDDDIDIGMLRSDAEKLKEILNADDRFYVRDIIGNVHNGNGMHHLLQIRWADIEEGTIKLYIDIFTYDLCDVCDETTWNWFVQEKNKLIQSSYNFPQTTKGVEKNAEAQEELNSELSKWMKKINDKLEIRKNEGEYIVWGFDNLSYANYKDNHIFEYDKIFPLKKLIFEGKECYVPNKYMEYIEVMYEDIYSLPNDMLSHKHFKLNDKKKKILNALYEKCYK